MHWLSFGAGVAVGLGLGVIAVVAYIFWLAWHAWQQT